MITKSLQIQPKQIALEAMQWTGDNIVSLRLWLGDLLKQYDGYIKVWNQEQGYWADVTQGEYIIKGIKGEFYPCSEEVFNKSYDVVD